MIAAAANGAGGISDLYPTLLTPNTTLLGAYWMVLYVLQIGYCLTLVTARKDVTKETLVYGVGLRFAIANWLMAGWAVCWVCSSRQAKPALTIQTLQFFIGSAIFVLANVLIM